DAEPAALAEPDAAGVRAAGEHDDQVRAEALDLLGHAGLRARAHADHGDDRAHADDDAEHGQRAAQLVDPQRAEGDAGALQRVHASASSASRSRSRGISAREAAAARGAAMRSSRTTRPSRKPRARPAWAATSASWVTITIVMPSRLSPWSRARISRLVRV